MAGDSVIGALRVVLGADTASFEDGMKGAGKTLSDFGNRVAAIGAGFGATLGAALVGISTAMVHTIDQIDKMGKMSESMGIPIEALSELKLAADVSGVSLEALAKSFSSLNKNMALAATTANSGPARAFQAIGISVRDASGNLKGGEQALIEIAGKFASYQDGAAKSALATQLFGKQGAALIPLLNLGSDGIAKMTALSQELGLTLDNKTKNAASEFNNNLTIMGKIWDGILTKIAVALLPAFEQLSGAFMTASKNSSLVSYAADAISASFTTVINVGIRLQTIIEATSSELKAFLDLMNSNNIADTKNLWGVFVDESNKAKAAIDSAGDRVKAFWQEAATNSATLSLVVKKNMAPLTEAAKSVEAPIDAFLLSQSKQITKLQATADALTMTTAEGKAYIFFQEALNIAIEKQIPLTDELMNKIYNAAEAYGKVASQTELATLKFNQLKQIGQDVGGALSSSIQDAIKNGGKLINVLGALGMKLLDIGFQAAAAKPLQNLFGNLFSGSQAPIAPLFGFASGGSFNVGGSGGIDSQMVAFKASPNENVTVTKPGQGEGSAGQIVFAPQYTFAPGMTGNDMAVMKSLIAQSNRQTIADIQKLNRNDSRALYR